MKKSVLTITAIALASITFAQKAKVVSAYNYNKNFARSGKCSELKDGLDAINEAIEHDQTKSWAKTWYYRGNLYYNILATNNQECKSLDAEALEKCTDSYLTALVYNFKDPELQKLDLKKEDGSDIMKFFTALQNGSAVDDETYTGDIMGRKFPGIAGEYANKGIKQFGEKDYKGAQQSFGTSMMLNQFTGKIDTMIMYNTALASEYAEDFDAAKQLYDALIAMKYNVDGAGPDLYRSMSRIYKNEGNAEKAADYIKSGRKAYPDNNNLIVDELEGYLSSGNHEQALANLDAAIANDPSNVVLHFARGTVYENLKQPEKAIENYKKAIELDANYYDANFNLGAYFFNNGADKMNAANDLPINEAKKYEALKKEAKAEFEKAVPYVEKAHELKPDDADTGNMLIKLYTHTGQYDKAAEIKKKYQ
ncbi:MAG: tetratricopeptide repeat protein [Flavobacteriales bacterium]|nr:tetratricopeptide repeat protein [Flavobacteriales bacterium]